MFAARGLLVAVARVHGGEDRLHCCFHVFENGFGGDPQHFDAHCAEALVAPPRKRNPNAAPRKPKSVELKRTHPPASAFAATVAAHAAHTAKLQADPNSLLPQPVAPLFACVVMPPTAGGVVPGMPAGMQAGGGMQVASAASVGSAIGLAAAAPPATYPPSLTATEPPLVPPPAARR